MYLKENTSLTIATKVEFDLFTISRACKISNSYLDRDPSIDLLSDFSTCQTTFWKLTGRKKACKLFSTWQSRFPMQRSKSLVLSQLQIQIQIQTQYKQNIIWNYSNNTNTMVLWLDWVIIGFTIELWGFVFIYQYRWCNRVSRVSPGCLFCQHTPVDQI